MVDTHGRTAALLEEEAPRRSNLTKSVGSNTETQVNAKAWEVSMDEPWGPMIKYLCGKCGVVVVCAQVAGFRFLWPFIINNANDE